MPALEYYFKFDNRCRRSLSLARISHFRVPLRRAALLRQRAVLVALMVLNRLAANRVPTEPPLTVHVPAPPGTPVLRTCLRAALTAPLHHGMNLGGGRGGGESRKQPKKGKRKKKGKKRR